MKKENKNLYEYKSELLSLSNEKTNSMKNLVHCLQCIVLSILFCVNSVRAQEIEFDANTLTLNADPEIFKVGAVIKIKVIEDDPSTKPDIEVTISFSDVRNEAGIQKFKDTGIKDTKAASTGGYYLMSFRVENKDYTNITVKVIGDKFTHERTYKIRNHGGIKFDVSTGFLGTKVRDRSYVLSDSAGIGNKVFREKDGKFRGGICLLAHLHSRNPDLLNIGANVGFELNQDSKISYLAGLSLLLGEDQKFVLSGGALMSKVDRLSNAYYEGQLVDKAVTVLPLVKVWKVGSFLSVTYNF